MRQILTDILNILERREKLKLARLVLFDLAMGVLDVAFLGMTLVVINFYTKSQPAAVISFLPDRLLNRDSLLLISIFLVLFGLKNYLGYLNTKWQQHFFYGVSSRLSKRNIQGYLKDDYLRFVNIDSSVLIRRISQQPIEFSNYVLTNLQQIISQSILITATITGILFWQPGLFFMLFLLLTPPVILLGNFIRNKLKAIRYSTQLVSQKTIQHLNESLAGYIESNVYRKDDFFVKRYYDQQLQLNNNIATQQTLQGLSSRLIEVFAILGFFILIAINKLSAGQPAVSLLTIGVFLAASYKIIPGIVKILNSASQIKTYRFSITDLQPAGKAIPIVDEKTPVKSILFEQVKFRYDGRYILNSLNFDLRAGDFAGISAPSGKGKTTIIHLMLGFLKHHKGNIYFNGEKTNWIKRQGYLNRVSYVKQQSFIINDTLLKNITLSDGAYDKTRLDEVLSFCGLQPLVNHYPGGINEFIKENGKNISGGQRQRLMLARALYHDFDLLVLDEAFSEMDEESENTILLKLKQLARQGKMVILITHNNASLNFCDKIIALDTTYA
ncbi:ABC transporter ATP-binding protein [Mucilaginibacter sp. UR6-11]|uniref:ATP-binding cassette domain-containing protein n=1 Tax=Mucilaginibacter sp. UR6-11 TaxID=1435644 RepID=UPI001E348B15|nr:ABC transporter ATP-binding protein [Mucilaginibacter sp. UR6-11]MCC8427171.1 ABC transporter ATP-binding protein/permease [Mucilaginibacter sp. UR6-11]